MHRVAHSVKMDPKVAGLDSVAWVNVAGGNTERTVGFHKVRGNSGLAQELSAYQGGFIPPELVTSA